MRVTPLKNLKMLPLLYPYTFEGPYQSPKGAYYLKVHCFGRDDPLFMRYEYALLADSYRKAPRPNQLVIFKDGNQNYNKGNLRLLTLTTSSLLGWGFFNSLDALDAHDSAVLSKYRYDVNGRELIAKTKEKVKLEPHYFCDICGKEVVLNRFQRYRLENGVTKSVIHPECHADYLLNMRIKAIHKRRAKVVARRESELMDLHVTHYIAKPMLTFEAVRSLPEDEFNACYWQLNKDYLPKTILTKETTQFLFGSEALTVSRIAADLLSLPRELRLHSQGPRFYLYTILTKEGTQFIHATW